MFTAIIGAIAIVTNGVTCSRIQMHRKASHVEVRAANELSEVLKKISGASVPYTISPGGDYLLGPYCGAEIVLVTEQWGKNLLPKRALDKLAATDNPDAFVIASREDCGAGKALCIGGKTPIAVYYGVYAFLENYLGCGFYHAEKDGTVIPSQKTIELPEDIFDFREPWIRYRRMSCWHKIVAPLKLSEMFAWQAKRSFQWWLDGALRGSMSFPESALTFSQLANLPFNCGGEPFTCQAVPVSMFQEHPEYFTLIKGKRVAGKYPARRCYSNPDVIRLCVKLGIAFSDYGGEVAVQMTDTPGGWCECGNCRRYGEDEHGVWSGENYAHRFMGDVCAGILAERPDADLVVDAYLHWRELPACEFKHDKRVKLVYAPHQRCYVHALDDKGTPCNRHFNELYLKWLEKYPRHGIFDYYCYAATEYAPVEYVFSRDMKYYHAHGLDHFVEDTSNGSIVEMYPYNNWQFYYIFSKMIWNPELDVEKEMDKAYRRYYGKAVEPMLKYHAFRRHLWETAPGHSYMGGSPRHGNCLREPGSQEKLDELLKAAETLAKGDRDVESRVGRDRRCFEGIWVKRWEDMKEMRESRASVKVAAAKDGEVKINGVLDEAVWKDATVVTGLVVNGEVPKTRTDFRIAKDSKNWYVAVDASAVSPKTKILNRDGFVWEDDGVEVAISTPKGDYYHFIINSAGTLYDACGMGIGFTTSGELKAVKAADRYTIELRVPFSDLEFEAVKPGEGWGLFLARTALPADMELNDAESAKFKGAYAHNPNSYAKAEFE